MTYKPWQPGAVLISQSEISAAMEHADDMGWYFCPSPINAAFITMLVIMELYDEN